MATVSHTEVLKRFPGISDHTVLEILRLEPTEAELDAVKLLAGDVDEDLVEFKQQDSDRLNQLLAIVEAAGLGFEDDRVA